MGKEGTGMTTAGVLGKIDAVLQGHASWCSWDTTWLQSDHGLSPVSHEPAQRYIDQGSPPASPGPRPPA
jgi:hypothetical protein